jgi:GT2 family glycosyltransferase
MPTVSIVVVHWKDEARLMRCVTSLRRDLESTETTEGTEGNASGTLLLTDVELILVENGPEGRAPEALLNLWPEVMRVALPRTLGFAAGANSGIAQATGEWIELVNDDVEVCAGFHAALAAAAASADAACGMLQPRLVSGSDPGRIDSTGVVVTRHGLITDRDRGGASVDCSEAGEVFCPSAAAAWYRKRMLDEVSFQGHCFDPDYFMYFEDVDLGWRCRLAGWSARYVGGAIARHEGQASARRRGDDFVRTQCMRNRLRVLLANGTVRLVFSASPRLILDALGLILVQGASGVGEVVRSARAGLSARRGLAVSSRRARSAVERAWMGSR